MISFNSEDAKIFNQQNTLINRDGKDLSEAYKDKSLVEKFNKTHASTMKVFSSLTTDPMEGSALIDMKINLLDEDNLIFKLGEEMSLLGGMVKPEHRSIYNDVFKFGDRWADKIAEMIDQSPEDRKEVLENLKKYPEFYSTVLNRVRNKENAQNFYPNRLIQFATGDAELNRQVVKLIASDLFNFMIYAPIAEIMEEFGFDEGLKKELVNLIKDDEDNRSFLIDYYSEFEISDDQFNYEMALYFLEKMQIGYFCRFVHNLEIRDEALNKKLISKILEKPGGLGAVVDSEKFYFEDFEDLEFKKSFVKEAVNKGKNRVLDKIDISAIDDPDFHREVASSMLQNQSGKVILIRQIDKFNLDRESKKSIFIELITAGEISERASQEIDRFGFDDLTLKEIANQIVLEPMGALRIAQIYPKFHINDLTETKDLALKIVEQEFGAYSLACSIQNFDFGEDLDFKRELAQKIVQSPSGALGLSSLKSWDDFGITDLKGKQDLIKQIVAFEEIYGEAPEIFNNHIKPCIEGDREFLNEIRELMIQTEAGTFCLGENIDEISGDDLEFKKRVITRLADFEKGAVAIVGNEIAIDDKDFMNHILFKVLKFNDLKFYHPSKIQSLGVDGEFLNYFAEHNSNQTKLSKWEPKSRFDPKLISQIAGIEHKETKENLSHWLFYWGACGDFHQMPEERRDQFFGKELLEPVYKIRNHEMRLNLVEHLTHIFANASDEDYKAFLTRYKKSSVSTRALEIMLTSLELDEVSFGSELHSGLKKKLSKFLRDGTNRVLFLQTLQALSQSPEVTPGQIVTVVDYLSHFSGKPLLSELRCFSGLEKFQRLGDLTDPPTSFEEPKWIRNHLLEVFEDCLEGFVLSDSEQKEFDAAFIHSRMPEALPVYVAGLQKLHDRDRVPVMKTISDYIKDVTSGAFPDRRYEDSVHLDRIYESKEGLKEMWEKGMSPIDLSDYVQKEEEKIELNFRELISMKLKDRHLPVERLPKLGALLRGEEFGGEQDRNYQVVENMLCDLCEKKYSNKGLQGKLTTLRKKMVKADSRSEFLNDIDAFRDALKPKKTGIEGWKIVDSDDPIDLLLSGTEVAGSCQRISGQPSLNKALMGYVMDGKHRMLAIKDKNGRVMGRLILRLLWDEKNGKPVLFFERVYPNTLQKSYQRILKDVAIARADELGVDLVSKETISDTFYEGTVESLGTKENVPFEYCDATRGIEIGPFRIRGCYKLN
ncbi:MAG: hypothetical protein K940chlam3_00157 [Chlamydiae bacterium]|nr:hypothetical protein [Chlamydiota bacterium]